MTNSLIYDTDALYNQHMDEDSQNKFTLFYKELFSKYNISTVHDCSIGAGGTTLPLSKLGYFVSGSDINENLLNKAKQNFEDNGFVPNLFLADFRNIGAYLGSKVDCIISTGNSIPHVDLDGFNAFLQSASTKLNDGGLLFFDIRNWNSIVKEKPIINAIDPKIMTADEHRSIYLLFNWHDNGSVTFSFATSVDRNGKHISLDIIHCPVYYPLIINDIKSSLLKYGYKILQFIDMDKIWLTKSMEKKKIGDFDTDFDNIQWYGVLAKKFKNNK